MRLLTTAFKLSDTHGLPLAMQLIIAEEKGYVVSIPHFYRDALAAGWKPNTALARIEEALRENGAASEYVEAALEWLRRTGGKQLPVEE